MFHHLFVRPLQAIKPRGVVIFVHGHGAYLLHELLRVNVSASAPTWAAVEVLVHHLHWSGLKWQVPTLGSGSGMRRAAS